MIDAGPLAAGMILWLMVVMMHTSGVWRDATG